MVNRDKIIKLLFVITNYQLALEKNPNSHFLFHLTLYAGIKLTWTT
jgi:hypothetical protein